jgi:hypothetical protein
MVGGAPSQNGQGTLSEWEGHTSINKGAKLQVNGGTVDRSTSIRSLSQEHIAYSY